MLFHCYIPARDTRFSSTTPGATQEPLVQKKDLYITLVAFAVVSSVLLVHGRRSVVWLLANPCIAHFSALH